MGNIFNFKKDSVAKTSDSKKVPEKKNQEDPNKFVKISLKVLKYANIGLAAYSAICGIRIGKKCPVRAAGLLTNSGMALLNANLCDMQLEMIDLEEYVDDMFSKQSELNHAVADAFKDHSDLNVKTADKLTSLGLSNALDIERIYRALEYNGVDARKIYVSDILANNKEDAE